MAELKFETDRTANRAINNRRVVEFWEAKRQFYREEGVIQGMDADKRLVYDRRNSAIKRVVGEIAILQNRRGVDLLGDILRDANAKQAEFSRKIKTVSLMCQTMDAMSASINEILGLLRAEENDPDTPRDIISMHSLLHIMDTEVDIAKARTRERIVLLLLQIKDIRPVRETPGPSSPDRGPGSSVPLWLRVAPTTRTTLRDLRDLHERNRYRKKGGDRASQTMHRIAEFCTTNDAGAGGRASVAGTEEERGGEM